MNEGMVVSATPGHQTRLPGADRLKGRDNNQAVAMVASDPDQMNIARRPGLAPHPGCRCASETPSSIHQAPSQSAQTRAHDHVKGGFL